MIFLQLKSFDSHLHSGFPSDFFPTEIPTKILHAFPMSFIHKHVPLTYYPNNIYRGISTVKLLIIQSSIWFLLLFPLSYVQMFSSASFSDFSLTVREHVSYPCKTTGKNGRWKNLNWILSEYNSDLLLSFPEFECYRISKRFISCLCVVIDRLCGLVVRVSGY
jgi:hypothetical protein